MKRFIAFTLCAFMLLTAFVPMLKPAYASGRSVNGGVSMGAKNDETLIETNDPERGFYHTMFLNASLTENTAVTCKYRLMHFRVGLGCFSHNFLKYTNEQPDNYVENGYTPLSESFLAALNETMENIRKKGATAVIRFSYDNFEGIPNMEPSMEGVLLHISQLSNFFKNNADVILAVESGFLGPWGEQHSSTLVDKNNREQNLPAVVNALLDVVPAPITVSVRRPLFYAYTAGIDQSDFDTHRADKNSKYYRVGIYNDGYLGSENDRGTFTDRKKEVEWLSYQAAHTAYGGETALNYSTDGIVYNSIDYISKEMFQTHTTYLNSEWEKPVLNEWKNSVYTGSDKVYYGENAYLYISNHLGYRFVLRDSRYFANEKTIRILVENVGAGNVLKSKNVTVTLTDENNSVTRLSPGINVMTWQSRTTTEEAIKLPSDIAIGRYKVYLNIRDVNGNQIRFANDNEFNEYGNYIGSINVSDTSTQDGNNCTCLCHRTGFMGVIWKILNFFYRLFNTNQYCRCGIEH